MPNFYAGIGSRETPQDILKRITDVARSLDERGFILRSGGAVGADMAFEAGATNAEIFLPWASFGSKWNRVPRSNDTPKPTREAIELAKKLTSQYKDYNPHAPDWVLLLIARNMHQVLGKTLDSPVKLVVCYTKNGEENGGTRWAIRLAKKHSIPICNYGEPKYER